MAAILIIDDHVANREFLRALLSYKGHRVLEAADGAEGLAAVRGEHPDLVICDLLMPTMDGFEFVRQLRADPAIAATGVVFYTANYRERETYSLALASGVRHILSKPCEPEEVLRVVELALSQAPAEPAASVNGDFDRQHLRVMTDKLSEQSDALQQSNERLAALTDLNLQLASEREAHVLLEKVCRGARELLGAKYAIMSTRDKKNDNEVFVTVSGIDSSLASSMQHPAIDAGHFGRVMLERRARRFRNAGGDPGEVGFPTSYPPVHACIIAPIISLAETYGWICLIDKLGADEFNEDDARVASILGAQVGRIYENGSLFAAIEKYAAHLEAEIVERNKAQGALAESERRYRDMLDNVQLVSMMLDRDARITYCNDCLLRLTGWRREDLLGRNWIGTLTPADAPDCQALLDDLLAGLPDALHPVSEILTRSGERRVIQWNNSLLRGPDGREVIGTASIGEDITERTRAEESVRGYIVRLEALRALDRAILEAQSPGAIASIGLRYLRQLVSFWGATVMTIDLRADQGSVLATDRLPQSLTGSGPRFPLDEYGRDDIKLLARGIDCIVPDLSQASDLPLRLRGICESGGKSSVRLPLMAEGELIGTLNLWANEAAFFSDEQVDIARTIADQLAIALRQSLLRGEVSTHQAALERKVILRTEQLESANQELEAFSYTVSHDLRGPVRHIEGFLRILREHLPYADPTALDYMDRIKGAAERMNAMIEGLLALARTSAADLRRKRLELRPIVDEVIANLAPIIGGRNIEWVISPLPPVYADATLMHVLLENLISNAVKYTSKRELAKIEIGARSGTAGASEFFVRDNGAGYDMKYSGKLFEPFERMHDVGEFEGTGIGLATVRRIITRHDGRIWSTGKVGEGAEFCFRLDADEPH